MSNCLYFWSSQTYLLTEVSVKYDTTLYQSTSRDVVRDKNCAIYCLFGALLLTAGIGGIAERYAKNTRSHPSGTILLCCTTIQFNSFFKCASISCFQVVCQSVQGCDRRHYSLFYINVFKIDIIFRHYSLFFQRYENNAIIS